MGIYKILHVKLAKSETEDITFDVSLKSFIWDNLKPSEKVEELNLFLKKNIIDLLTQTNRLLYISPEKMVLFGISRELKFGVCNHEEQVPT